MSICGLSRATEKDIDRCFNAVKYAPRHRIHTFLATSDIHLEHKLGISRPECVEQAARAVAHASALLRDTGGDVEFSPEDAGRSDPAFLVDVLTAVIEAGATTLNIPDTVGFVTPGEYGDLFKRLIAETPGGTLIESSGPLFCSCASRLRPPSFAWPPELLEHPQPLCALQG